MFSIRLYIGAISLGCQCPRMCPLNGYFPWISPNGYFLVPLNGSLTHKFCGTYVFTNQCLCINTQHTPVNVCDSDHVVHLFYYSCLIFLDSFSFLFPLFPLLGSIWGITNMTRSLNLLKIDPWLGLVSKYPVVSPVVHHYTDIPHLQILSVIKYLILMCFICLLLKDLSFFSIRIALLLYW